MTEASDATKKGILLSRWLLLLAFVLVGGLANALLSLLNMAISSPFFFDSIFTAVTAALFGSLAGMVCALFSQFILEAFHEFDGGGSQACRAAPHSRAGEKNSIQLIQ
jgi:hypothetical protein